MKILVISDIHSNIWALEQILETEKDLDLICCAGDLTDYGTAPAAVIERMRGLSRAIIVQGNHDAHVGRIYREGVYDQMPPAEFKWVHHNCQQISAEQAGYLEQLPVCQVFEADGYSYLVRHQYDHAYGTIESVSQFEQFWQKQVPPLYQQVAKRRMIFGHTHRQCIHTLADDMTWLNPGSVSYRRPDDQDKTAHYAVIEDGEISLRRIGYNRLELLNEARMFNRNQAMMETELQDFYFFFGDAKTSRDPLPDPQHDGPEITEGC